MFSFLKRKKKARVLYVIKNYPQLSQTYIKSEIQALKKDFDIKIIATSVPNVTDTEHFPYQHIKKAEDIAKEARNFKPSVIHGHYLVHAKVISDVAHLLEVPFTIRAHSFDAIVANDSDHIPAHIQTLSDIVHSDLCLGLLAFPFTRKLLENHGGIAPNKIIDVPPVVDFHKFYNRQKNGLQVMNTGACIPKKRMEDFIDLASLVADRTFNLYAIGHNIDNMIEYNKTKGNVLNIIPPIPFSKMPSAYKKHGWIVYTADFNLKTVGWPMALAEAQASGVIACMANIRPDIQGYLGDTGYIFNSVDEMIPILASEPDKTKREAGFDNARKYDIYDNIHLLTDLWEAHLS